MMSAVITVHTQREYFHGWPEAPDEVAFLRFKHRHMFHVKLTLPVKNSDREKEFFIVQRWMREALTDEYGPEGSDLGRLSCEDIATHMVKVAAVHFECSTECEVLEDNENGARVTYTIDENDTE